MHLYQYFNFCKVSRIDFVKKNESFINDSYTRILKRKYFFSILSLKFINLCESVRNNYINEMPFGIE